MQYRNLGRSGLKVSTVSLGSWLTFGNTVQQAEADRVVHAAFERGVNLFDTADIYNRGEGETALGSALRSLPRANVVIATKCFFPMSDDPNDRGLSRKHITESVHQSLRRLNTDYVDLYQCHRPDPDTPVEETVLAMNTLIEQGKVLYWGVSCWEPERITLAVQFCRQHGLNPPISNQPPYNLFDRHIEASVLPTCEALGVGQIVFSPLAQGVLTGKYRSEEPPAADTRAGDGRINQFIERFTAGDRLERAARLRAMAEKHDTTAGALALAWCLRQSNVSSAIVGARNAAQIEANVAAAEQVLPVGVEEALDEVFPA